MKMFKSLVFISFFLAITTTFVHAVDGEAVTDVNGNKLHPDGEPVTDVNGNKLRPGARYYMEVPSVSTVGPDSPSCPTGFVVLDESKRRPISIAPIDSGSTDVVLEDTYVTVRFNYSYPCRMLISLVWMVDWSDGRVMTHGVERLHRFKLTKYEGESGSNKYQLAACPVSECKGGCRCQPVGYVEENGVTYLVADTSSNRPTPFVFVPVKKARIENMLPSM